MPIFCINFTPEQAKAWENALNRGISMHDIFTNQSLDPAFRKAAIMAITAPKKHLCDYETDEMCYYKGLDRERFKTSSEWPKDLWARHTDLAEECARAILWWLAHTNPAKTWEDCHDEYACTLADIVTHLPEGSKLAYPIIEACFTPPTKGEYPWYTFNTARMFFRWERRSMEEDYRMEALNLLIALAKVQLESIPESGKLYYYSGYAGSITEFIPAGGYEYETTKKMRMAICELIKEASTLELTPSKLARVAYSMSDESERYKFAISAIRHRLPPYDDNYVDEEYDCLLEDLLPLAKERDRKSEISLISGEIKRVRAIRAKDAREKAAIMQKKETTRQSALDALRPPST